MYRGLFKVLRKIFLYQDMAGSIQSRIRYDANRNKGSLH